jgi:hypothetical protein
MGEEMQNTFLRVRILGAIGGAGYLLSSYALADVTIQQQSVFDLSIVKAHSESTEYTTSDKQRRESALHCEGFMSLLCGNSESGEIIRLDRDVQWTLQAKKKEYLETPFLTAAQRLELQQQAQATLEKMKECPAKPQQTAPGPDQSKCQMSPPQFNVQRTDSHATFAGHDARLTQLSLTESCKNPDTGDTCDFTIGMDAWLTQEQIAGLEDKRAFQSAYVHKLGLDDPNGMLQAQIRQFLAPYAGSLKQLAAKAGDMKGYPLKTAIRISFGGERCAAAQNRQSDSSGQDSSSGAPTNLGSAATAIGSKFAGLFGKKKADDTTDPSVPAASPLPPGMIQAAQFSVETKSITVGPVAPDEFEIPAGWKLVQPAQTKSTKEFSCPQS